MSVIEQVRVEHPVSAKIHRLSTASAKRVIEPDTDLPGHIGPGQIIPDDLLSVAGLDLDLSDEQKAKLSREEVGSITTAGVIFEAVLEAGFALQITRSQDFTDPRITFLLHEIGEETRHQRMFIRMLEDLRPTAVHPLDKWSLRAIQRFVLARFIQRPALLYTLVLGGEEIPDLIQKKAAEHPGTDPFIQQVNRYHRQEEARHLSFARAVLPEVFADAGQRRPLPRPPGRPDRDRRHVRHARAPRCVRDRRAARLGHLEGRPGLEGAHRAAPRGHPAGPAGARRRRRADPGPHPPPLARALRRRPHGRTDRRLTPRTRFACGSVARRQSHAETPRGWGRRLRR